jgi:ribosomal protein S18 acetylase RimI-like enzyme
MKLGGVPMNALNNNERVDDESIMSSGNRRLIRFDENKKDLPCDQLHRLFRSVGWSNRPETDEMRECFNLPFINSTLVVSAWENERLVGAVRVLSDKVIRSVIYDLVVDPEYQRAGIGKELVRRCLSHFPNTEWLVQTTNELVTYYERLGFTRYKDVVLYIPSKWVE